MINDNRARKFIEACYACAIACERCATADLKESDVKALTHCINLNRECAVFCIASAHILSLGGSFSNEICTLCAKICEACADECEKHTHMQHCKACAEACRSCARECRTMALESWELTLAR